VKPYPWAPEWLQREEKKLPDGWTTIDSGILELRKRLSIALSRLYHDRELRDLHSKLYQSSSPGCEIILRQLWNSIGRVVSAFQQQYVTLKGQYYGGERSWNDTGVVRDGHFWNVLRPHVGCAGLFRLCEEADGCRFVCNPLYLKFGHEEFIEHQLDRSTCQVMKSARDSPSRKLTALGIGSNLQWDWERDLLTLFNREPRLGNEVGRLMTADCTVPKPSAVPWEPHPLVSKLRAEGGFTFAHECLYGGPESPPDPNAAFTKRHLHDLRTLPQMLQQIQNNTNFPADAAPFVSTVDFVKMDMEGAEYAVVQDWLRAELEAIAQATDAHSHIPGEGKFVNVNHRTITARVPRVGTFQAEIHRRGHMNRHGSNFFAFAHMAKMFSEIYALGKIAVTTERNPWESSKPYSCCYEYMFVDYRLYIASELWMSINGGSSDLHGYI